MSKEKPMAEFVKAGTTAELASQPAGKVVESGGERQRLEASEDLRRVIEERFVYDALFERSPVQLGAGLDHKRQFLLTPGPLDHFRQIHPAACAVERQHRDSQRLEGLPALRG